MMALVALFACNTGTPKEKVSDAPAAEPVVLTLSVEGMTCTGCEQTICTEIAKVGGVVEVKASHVDGIATLTFSGDMADTTLIMEAVNGAGYKALGFIPAKQDSVIVE